MLLAVAGEGTCHRQSLTHSCGVVAPVLGTVAIRILPDHSPAVAISWLALPTGQFRKPLNGISILLCPPAYHTSPMRMFPSFTLLASLSPFSVMTMVCGVKDAFGVATVSNHVLSCKAVVRKIRFVQLHLTSTVDLGVALPQSRASVCCCNTMLSLTKSGNTILALALIIEARAMAVKTILPFFILLFC